MSKIKPQFLSEMIVSNLNDNTWELKSDLIYESKILNDKVVAPTGFVTDFASVPRVPVVYLVAGGAANEAAVVHDFLYQKHLCGKLKADRVFFEAMKVTKIPSWRRWVMYSAVVAFGWLAYASGPDRYKVLNVKSSS